MDRMLAVIADNPVATAAGLAGMVCLAVWPLSMWPDNETDRDFLNFSGWLIWWRRLPSRLAAADFYRYVRGLRYRQDVDGQAHVGVL